jgi:hypothetical protein
VRIYASPWYRHDDAWLKGWAGFFDALFHNVELSRLTLVFLPESNSYYVDIGDVCGSDAGGCYDPVSQTIYAPGNHLSNGTRMETVIAHEYGHHIAANRNNAPWNAYTWGPKRWASYMNICARTEAGQAFPGDEGAHYTLNPGEGFAEAYRLMVYNSYIWGSWTPAPWNIVDPSFMPDAAAQAAAREDALSPWDVASGTPWRFAGKLTKRRRAVMLNFTTRYDGDLTVRLFRPYAASLTLIDGSGAIVGTRSGSFSYTVCGDRSMRIRLKGSAGSRYDVQVATP